MSNNTGKVNIPTNVEEKLQLAKLVYAKHQADGTGSPLRALTDVNWDDIGPNLQTILDKHLEAEELRRQMELAFAERDAMLPDVEIALRSARNLLKGIYMGTPQALGNWGFEVDHAKAQPRKTPIVPPAS